MSLLSLSLRSIKLEQNNRPHISQILCDVQKLHGGRNIAEHIHSSQQYSHRTSSLSFIAYLPLYYICFNLVNNKVAVYLIADSATLKVMDFLLRITVTAYLPPSTASCSLSFPSLIEYIAFKTNFKALQSSILPEESL